MIHPFTFRYEDKDYYFVWDIESGSLHIVDRVAFLCVKNSFSVPFSKSEESEFFAVPETERVETLKEIEDMKREGSLGAPPAITHFEKKPDHLKALCLHICHDCNLNCEYCFAAGGTYHTERDYMSFEVGKAAVDMLIGQSGGRKNLEIDFFGGEPLLNLDVVKKIVGYAREEERKFGKIFSFTMTTNCLGLNDENIAWLNKEMDNVVLSIDGREAIHNNVRKTINGNNAYPVILKNALKMKEARNGKRYYVRGTFTANNLDFSEDVFFLNDCGFDQISVEPVVLPDTAPLAIKKEHLEQIAKEYDRLAEGYIDRRKNGKWFNFFHFMIDLEHGPCLHKRLNGCGAGIDYLAVSPIGDLYPCHQFTGEAEYLIGNVFDGVKRPEVRERFAANSLLKKEHCVDCPAKYYCGGGCSANAKNFSGSIEGRYEIGCELQKKRMELSLAIAALEKSREN